MGQVYKRLSAEIRNQSLKELATTVYLVLMLLVFPLFYHNNYIDIVQAKKYFFLGATLIYMFLCAGDTVVGRLAGRTSVRENRMRRKSGMDICMCLLLAGLVASTLLAEQKADAFWGFGGRRLGAVVLLAGAAGYFCVSKYFRMSGVIRGAFLAGSGMVFLLVVCNTFQLDPLQMKENLAPAQHYFFVGTMGNIDVTAEFGGLMVSAGMTLFYFAKKRVEKAVYGGYLVLGFGAMLCCRCDTAAVCIAAAFLVTGWNAMLTEEGMRKLRQMLLLWILASAGIGALRHVWSGRVFAFDGLCLLAVSGKVILAELILWTGLKWCAWRTREWKELQRRRFRKGVFGILAAGGAILAVMAAIANITPAGSPQGAAFGGGILERLKITDAFGNYRGYIWKRSIQSYLDAPLLRQLFGYGMNQFPAFIQAYETEMQQLFQQVFIDAHSAYLQLLAASGIVGFAGYFGLFISGIRSCICRLKEKNDLAAILGMNVLTVSLIQAAANSPQVFTTPFCFLFLGILNVKFRKTQSVSPNTR